MPVVNQLVTQITRNAHEENGDFYFVSEVSRMCSALCLVPAMLSVFCLYRSRAIRHSTKAILIAHYLIANGIIEFAKVLYFNSVLSMEKFGEVDCFRYVSILIYGQFQLPMGILMLMIETAVELLSPNIYSAFTYRVAIALVIVAQICCYSIGLMSRNELRQLVKQSHHSDQSDLRVQLAQCNFDALLPQVTSAAAFIMILILLMGLVGLSHWIGALYGPKKQTALYSNRIVMFCMMFCGALNFSVIIFMAILPLLQLGATVLMYSKIFLEVGRVFFLTSTFLTFPPFKSTLFRRCF